MARTTTIWPGYELSTTGLQKLYRERYLKISQTEMAILTGLKQPNIAAYECGKVKSPCVDNAYSMLGFSAWSASIATCDEEASMIEDMLIDDSGAEWMPGTMWAKLEEMRADKKAAS